MSAPPRPGVAPLQDPNLASAQFLESLETCSPTIPDEVTNFFLAKTGFQCSDVRVKRLISLAAQKFIADIADDAMQTTKNRQVQSVNAAGKKTVGKEKKVVLTLDDLAAAVNDYGITIRKPDYFADKPTSGVVGASAGKK